MRLDVGTLAFSTAVLSLALAATTAFIAVGRGDRLTRFCFSGSSALYGAGLLLIVFWRLHPTAVVCGNTLVMASAICAHLGACTYSGRTVRPVYYVIGISVVILGLILSFMEWGGGTTTRIVVISGARLPYFIHATYVLFTNKNRSDLTISSLMLQVMFASFSLVLAVRIFDVVIYGVSGHAFTDWVGFQAAYYLVVAVIMLSMSITFALMCAEEDEKHLRRTIDLRTAELRQAKGLAEQASAAKSRFIAAASHDLRQPVHALRLLTSAAEGLASADDAELSELIVEMKASTTRLADYLHALLDISKLDAGVVIPDVRDTNVGDLLFDLGMLFKYDAIAADVRLHVVDTSCMIRTDPLLLKRILANLIANAIKFAEGGTVLVGCRRRGDSLEIQVCDNGCGIENNAIPEIFNEFSQVGNDARQASKGLGLGLNIVQRLCDLLGHRTSVISHLGRGSIFGITTPLSARQLSE